MLCMKSAESTLQKQVKKLVVSSSHGVRGHAAMLDWLKSARGFFRVDQMLTCRKSLAGKRGYP